MKFFRLLSISILSLILSSCGVLPIATDIKEDHFRLENFTKTKGQNREYVQLMCFKQRPTAWSIPRQYMAGQHSLWVKARISKKGFPGATEEAYVNFNVKLDSGKSYRLNREVDGGNISLWIQDLDTGNRASNLIVAELKRPPVVDERLTREKCESSTI
ncbi:MAG: hypothetical protein KUG78_21000 [Kangiellaceae bacterium]|nr:hypothetical protein [Kangiellaceae bacterium]